MSWACDLSSVTALSMTESKCEMDVNDVSSVQGDVHGGTHSGGSKAPRLITGLQWFVEQFAFITKLASETPAADGSSVLDNAALTLFFEGGHGFDPKEDDNINRARSSDNMALLVAGRAGGLRPGQHIRGADRHPAQVMVSCLNAVGVEN